MKCPYRILFGAIGFAAAISLYGCKKQITDQIAFQSARSSQAYNLTECKPAVLGVYSTYANSPTNGEWFTLAQKWYSNGKLKYLKAKSGRLIPTFYDPFLELSFILDWGEVSYQGNQVYLTDVPNNRLFMRVTLDERGRPAASYYYDNFPGTSSYWYDTTYYYYNGDRLDYMISMFETLSFTHFPFFGWRKYVFSYDSLGNLIKAQIPGSSSFNLQYDYSKPVSGMMSNFQLTSSLKILEYLGLLELPMHYALIRTEDQPPGYFGISRYADYVVTDGLVRSYMMYDDRSGRVITFYNGWDCNASFSTSIVNKPGAAISNLSQFKNVYLKSQ